MQLIVVIWVVLRFYSDNSMAEIWKSIHVLNLARVSFNLKKYFVLLLQLILSLVSFISCTVLSLFSLYYGLTCRLLRNLLQNVLEKVEGDCFPEDLENLFLAYVDITRCMKHIDNHLSQPAFLTVFYTMTGLFSGGYRLVFQTYNTNEYFLSLILPLIFYLSVQLMIMLSASITNELANNVKFVMQCLPYRNPSQDPEMKYKFEKDLNQENCLSLWKFYVMDRSLVITSIGTLLTYGILIGSLGK
ncbi:uncharacterized protein NPIL_695881 [Nephila pilipes]|uniref:Gustatory receptor n=1 Tax=Nephila pilipes TaxID=299642 RepID=A0A8X6NWW4_NEPPI|nr:uncharacterized protein NPIL_695881 [Nephila pilipes]